MPISAVNIVDSVTKSSKNIKRWVLLMDGRIGECGQRCGTLIWTGSCYTVVGISVKFLSKPSKVSKTLADNKGTFRTQVRHSLRSKLKIIPTN